MLVNSRTINGKERDIHASQAVAWRLMSVFEAQLRLLPENRDADPDALVAHSLAMLGRDLAENLAWYLSGDVDHIPGIDIIDEGARTETGGAVMNLSNLAQDIPTAAPDAAGHVAAENWFRDLGQRMGGKYLVPPQLRESFERLPLGQHGAFLDAIGALIVSSRAFGPAVPGVWSATEALRVCAMTPEEQDAEGEEE